MDKYLIINADDFGMCHAQNLAIMDLLRCGGIEELLSSDNPAVNGARELLRQALPRVGCSFEGQDNKRRGLFK